MHIMELQGICDNDKRRVEILALKLVNVNRSAGGDYRCDVRSRVGTNTSTSTLNVYCEYIYFIRSFWRVVLLSIFRVIS